MSRNRKRALAAVGILLGSGLLGMGLLHSPWGKPLLGAAGGGCPVGADKAAPAADLQKVTFAALAQGAGSVVAPSRPALGFVLDQTTREDARKWIATHQLSCEEIQENTVIRCKDVSTSDMIDSLGGEGVIAEVMLAFRTTDLKLFSVDTFRKPVEPFAAYRQVKAIGESLKKELGNPTMEAGKVDEHMDQNIYLLKYSFSDTLVELTSTVLPTGIAVRERYVSSKNGS